MGTEPRREKEAGSGGGRRGRVAGAPRAALCAAFPSSRGRRCGTRPSSPWLLRAWSDGNQGREAGEAVGLCRRRRVSSVSPPSSLSSARCHLLGPLGSVEGVPAPPPSSAAPPPSLPLALPSSAQAVCVWVAAASPLSSPQPLPRWGSLRHWFDCVCVGGRGRPLSAHAYGLFSAHPLFFVSSRVRGSVLHACPCAVACTAVHSPPPRHLISTQRQHEEQAETPSLWSASDGGAGESGRRAASFDSELAVPRPHASSTP